MVRAGTCASLPDSRLLYSRGHRCFRKPGIGYEIPGAIGKQACRIRCGFRLRVHPGGLLVYGAPALLGHLPHGSGARPRDRLSLFRARHQRSRHYSDRTSPRNGTRYRPGGGRDCLQHRDRRHHAFYLSQRGTGEGQCRHESPQSRDKTPAVERHTIFCLDDRHPHLRQTGEAGGTEGFWYFMFANNGSSRRLSPQSSPRCSFSGSKWPGGRCFSPRFPS